MDDQGSSGDTAYPLPEQQPRTTPPGNLAPHPTSNDNWITTFERSRPNFMVVLEELELAQASGGGLLWRSIVGPLPG